MKVYKDFDPAFLAMVKKVDPSAVKVWQLMDMEKLPTWTVGKLALLGDAAHPFTPRTSYVAVRVLTGATEGNLMLTSRFVDRPGSGSRSGH